MASHDDDSSWVRPVLTGVIALVAVSLLVGGVVGVIALGAAKMSGIGESSGAAPAAPSLFIPSGEPTTRPEAFPDPPGKKKKAAESKAPQKKKAKKKKAPPLTLQAVPAKAQSGERIDLSGGYRGGDGATLQVQRFEAGWTDFPVTATVRGGSYRTFIFTERAGKSRFRMLDKATGTSSNAVTITIG